jgi:hypothetical protein
MIELRTKVEANLRRSRVPSYEVTRQLSDLAMSASECTRKLTAQRVRLYSGWPTGGETTGGTSFSIRGVNIASVPRTAKVFFGTKEATSVEVVSDNEIIAIAPPADTEGYVEVRVTFTPGGTMTVPYGDTYRAPVKAPVKKPKAKPAPAPAPAKSSVDDPF